MKCTSAKLAADQQKWRYLVSIVCTSTVGIKETLKVSKVTTSLIGKMQFNKFEVCKCDHFMLSPNINIILNAKNNC